MWSFAKLEQLVWYICLEVFRYVLTQILLVLDNYLNGDPRPEAVQVPGDG
ncbi:MAG: hypothetical protein U1D96_04830 [Eubacteriales bacterium]|nr:hypothetical protein [Bacillota bacterium]MBV1728603.1 hypothetical protein [Desulforudis sp.]MDZ4042802.1 hypothetical protein [Eubacteriales bacterium]MBU4533697.1 hypothetical protein [Bacillota bacterium]MBU4554798.1 hypothetical protein [Bacillota bacterium]